MGTPNQNQKIVQKRMKRSEGENGKKQKEESVSNNPEKDGKINLNRSEPKMLPKAFKKTAFKQSAQKFLLTLASFQTSSPVESIDKEQIAKCVEQGDMIYDTFMKSKVASFKVKEGINQNDVIDLIFFLVKEQQKKQYSPKSCALKALNQGSDSFSTEQINWAVTDSKNFMNNVAKAKKAIKDMVHQEDQVIPWKKYRDMYFSGKYQMNKEILDEEIKFMKMNMNAIIRTCPDFTNLLSKVMITHRNINQELDLWYLLMRTVALIFEVKQFIPVMALDDNKGVKIEDPIEKTKQVVDQKIQQQNESEAPSDSKKEK